MAAAPALPAAQPTASASERLQGPESGRVRGAQPTLAPRFRYTELQGWPAPVPLMLPWGPMETQPPPGMHSTLNPEPAAGRRCWGDALVDTSFLGLTSTPRGCSWAKSNF